MRHRVATAQGVVGVRKGLFTNSPKLAFRAVAYREGPSLQILLGHSISQQATHTSKPEQSIAFTKNLHFNVVQFS